MTKKVIAINGSPRKDKNTAQLLQAALRGAMEKGAETQLVNLYDLNFHGCYSCFACKRLGSPAFGRCVHGDDLRPILKEIHEEADALIMGAPIYFGHLSAAMLSFQERLFFPYHDYSPEGKSLFPHIMSVGCIYTLGAPKEHAEQYHFDTAWKSLGMLCEHFFESYHELLCFDTLQFDDYSKFASSVFSEAHKKEVHEQIFPQDLAKAYELGQILVK